jgi:curved DNA-binding protein CbpA
MMPQPDYYNILEVPFNATLAQIKRSYRRLVRLHHPDLNKQANDRRIKQLNEAYEVLSDAVKRAAYDVQLLQEMRNAAIREAIRRQREEAQREPRMTWREGIIGFFTELKKGMNEE